MVFDQQLTRRDALKLAGASGIAVFGTAVALKTGFAQESTPATGGALAGLGLPEIDLTISDTGYEGLTGDLAAGKYLVHANYTGQQFGYLVFMQLPEGMASADLMAMLSGGGDMATPMSGEEGSGDAPPEWFYTVNIAGGVGLAAGMSADFVIDLLPGNYIVWGEDPGAMQAPVDLVVTGEMATPMATGGMMVTAGVTIDETGSDTGFAFEVMGEFSGSTVVEVKNSSDQPHFVEFDRLPDGATEADVDALFMSFMSGTPAAGGLAETDLQPVYLFGTQSAGTSQWHEISLDAGTYLLTCWIPDMANGGIPHAMEGMYKLITVGGDMMATPAS